ncbi:MAG: hypothetical protein IJ532_05080 [Alphaproteobacteria bacterium]|nr:hypothetical protein [Alphaproteobacteria bacterium]
MKKIVYFISVLMTCLCLNRNAQAFVWPDFTPLIPFSPQFCVMCIPPAIDWAYNTVDQVKDAKNRLKEMTDVTKIKQALSAYAANLGNMALNWATQKLSARKKVISYSRTIMDSEREGVDVKKEDSVKVDFVNLFLQYPSTKNKIKKAYQKKGDAIKTDTSLEMYITASEMMKELCGAKGKGCELATTLADYDGDVSTEFKDFKDMGMMLQLSLVEQCFMQGQYCGLIGTIGCEPGKDGDSSAEPSEEQPTEGESTDEDKVCHWKASLQLARMYDKIMRYNEMLVYMQYQYEAVKGIDTLAKIRAAKENEGTKGEQGAFLMDKYLPQKKNVAYSTLSDTFAFADEELTDEDLEEFSKYEKSMSNRENVLGGNFETLKEAKGFETVLDDKKDDLASMQFLEETNKALKDALVYHNMKQMLPDYRGTFKTLKQAEEYHDKTVEYLQDSGECIKGYLEPHYNNPAKVWFGEGCDYFDQGTIYCHYSPEKEINDSEESKGLYDELCPDNPQYKCFIQKLEESDMNKGVAGALLAFYNEGKTADALQETQTYLKEGEQSPEVETEKTSEKSYTAQVTIEGGDEVSGDKETYVTGRDDSAMMGRDNANASDVLPSASSVQAKAKTTRDDQEADENIKDPKAAESLADETRKGHLMNWIWGATMANVISADLDSSSPKFGTRKNKFPLWNDQKEFYDQYIDGKYDNISQYMERAPMPDGIMSAAEAINEVYNYPEIVKEIKDALGNVTDTITVTKDEQQGFIADAIEAVKDDFKDVKDETKETMDSLIETETAELEALKAEHNAKISKLLEEKELLQSRLGQTNRDLDAANQAFNNAGGKIASSVNTDRATKENDEANRELQAKYRNPVDLSQSPANKKFAGMKAESAENKKAAEAELKAKEKEAQNLEKSSEMLAKLLKAKKEEIEKERRQFVKKYSEAEENARNGFNDKVEAYLEEGVVLKDEDVTATIENAIVRASEKLSKELSSQYGTAISIELPTVAASGAGQMIACLREKASQTAKDTKEQDMNSLKANGKIYYNEYAPDVTNKHNSMINKMKSISECAIEGVPSEPIAEKVFGDMCDSVNCTTPDLSKDENGLINYFVGALGVRDDLKAPTPPVAFSSAPMREIFHFDIADYESIEKYYEDDEPKNPSSSDITITAEGFLKLGEDMQSGQKEAQQKLENQGEVAGTFPEIWKYVLRRHTYGQKQFDLKRLLGSKELGDDVRGNPDKSYLRSGSFPCYIDNNVIDASAVVKLVGFRLVPNNFSYSINSTPDKDLYTKVPCKGLLIKKGRVFDFTADGSPPNGVPVNGEGSISETSELGTILGYVPDANNNIVRVLFGHGIPTDMSKAPRKLTFNSTLQKAVNIISETEELGEDKSKDAVFYMANRTLLDRNQFGDYLNQVEQEAIARESLAKIQNQIDEILTNLQDVFYGTGIVISDEFNLLNDDDYKEAAEALDEQKQIYLNRAETEIQKVKGVSETVKNKTETLLKTIAVLRADSDEIIHLNGGEDINQVKSRIANQSADNSVGDEYEKMGDEAHLRRIRDLQPPFCEVHPYK